MQYEGTGSACAVLVPSYHGAVRHDEINEPGRMDVTSNVLGVIIEHAVLRGAVGCAD